MKSPLSIRLYALVCLASCLFFTGCSIKRMAVNKVGDALAGGGTTFSSDDDPELIKAAAPFSLKLMETLLAESPKHKGLLQALASGFTQYSYAFVHQEADMSEGENLEGAWEAQARARRLYLRARNYGLRGLEVQYPGCGRGLRTNTSTTVAKFKPADAALLFWTAAPWTAAISLSKDNADLIAELPLAEALMDRALQLDEDYSDGAIHSFLISYEMSRPEAPGDAPERARKHFHRAVQLTDGQHAGPYVSLAEAVCVQKQDLGGFKNLLHQALAVDPDQRPEWRLANMVAQKRARWLLSRTEELFLTTGETEK